MTQVEYYIYEIANPDNSYLSSRYTFSYNGNNQPVLIEDLYLKVTYQWDSNGNITFYERSESLDGQWIITDRYTLNNGGSIWETDNPWTKEREKTVMKNDGRGNPAIYQYYTWTAGKWYMTHYAVFYPNDLTSGEGLANEVVDVSPSSSAWSQNGIIHIRSARPQQVSVYSLSGAKLYEGRVQAGTTALDGVRFPKGIYIIVLSGGESLKAPVY
ncbi:MAG: hypothetical protein LBP64_06120 [Tannerella sp.]|nr:hypothetical protein [Tannerella sp.]